MKDIYVRERNKILNKIPKSIFKGHYSPIEVLKKGCSYTLIIAQRNNGKTYAMMALILYTWQVFGMRSVWIRRNKEAFMSATFKELYTKIFQNKLIPNIKGYDGIAYYRGGFRGYWTIDEKRKYDDIFLYTVPLSTSSDSVKGSMDILNLMWVVFDEFMSRDYYLKDEYIIFVNAISTILRESKGVSVVMLGNPVTPISWASPYFREMGLDDIQQIPMDTIRVYEAKGTNTSVCIERCGVNQSNINTEVINDRYFGFKNKRIESIKSGVWELPMYPHPLTVKGDKMILTGIYLIYNNQKYIFDIYHGTQGADDRGKGHYVVVHPISHDIDLDSDDVLRVYAERDTQGVISDKVSVHLKADRIDRYIWGLFKDNRFFYSDNTTGEAVRVFLQYYIKSINP